MADGGARRARETREIEEGLSALERMARGGERPSHYVARHVLLALGTALRERPLECAAWIERARAAGAAAGVAWREAVADELTLACGEFAQCLDPRYLGLPNYDMEYTRAARERLEDRLLAARELGFEPTPREVEVLTLADRVFESAKDSGRARGGPAAKPPGRAEGAESDTRSRDKRPRN